MRVPVAGESVGALLRGYQLWLRGQQQQLEMRYALAACDWEISQENGFVTYRRAGRVVLRATYVMIGSYCALNGTWVWAWANPTIKREYAVAPQQTLICAQRVGALGLAQPVVTIQDWSVLWQDNLSATTHSLDTGTAVGRLVSLMTYMSNGIGVQYYVNASTKTIGWVSLQCIYSSVESV